MTSSSNYVSSNLEKYLKNLLSIYQLEDIFFILYCYAHEQSQRTKSKNDNQEKVQWEKLINLLDTACDIIEETKLTG